MILVQPYIFIERYYGKIWTYLGHVHGIVPTRSWIIYIPERTLSPY